MPSPSTLVNRPDLKLAFKVYFCEAVATLHRLSDSSTKRTGLVRWNVLYRENMGSHTDIATRFLRSCNVAVYLAQRTTTLPHPHPLDLCMVMATRRNNVGCALLHFGSRVWIFSGLEKIFGGLDSWKERSAVESRVTVPISLHFLLALEHHQIHGILSRPASTRRSSHTMVVMFCVGVSALSDHSTCPCLAVSLIIASRDTLACCCANHLIR